MPERVQSPDADAFAPSTLKPAPPAAPAANVLPT